MENSKVNLTVLKTPAAKSTKKKQRCGGNKKSRTGSAEDINIQLELNGAYSDLHYMYFLDYLYVTDVEVAVILNE